MAEQPEEMRWELVEELAAQQDEEETAVPAVSPSVLLTQIGQMLQAYQAQGLVVQRPDGSYFIPGLANPLQKEVDRIGSLCECERCTIHNQLHWRCVSCFQFYEWATQRPIDGIALGTTGRGGLVYHGVCSQACGQAFRVRRNIRPGTTVPMEGDPTALPTVPETGGEFFLAGAGT